MHTDCGIAGVMRGELTKKRESTFPPSGFWVGGFGDVGTMVPLVGARDRVGSPIWNLGSIGMKRKGRSKKPHRFREGWMSSERT